MHTLTCEPRCNLAHERIRLEEKIIRFLLREAKKDGWLPFAVLHVENVPTTTEREVIAETSACDESIIRFRHLTRNVRSNVQVVRGNGIDCLVDCGTMMSATYDRVTLKIEDWT